MALFDRYLIVDWSAANKRTKRGKDAIWIAFSIGVELQWSEHFSTRHLAMNKVREVMRETLDTQQCLFVGFDFGFGYPKEFAEKLQGNWSNVWEKISRSIEDTDENKSNRFQAANHFNPDVFNSRSGPFWRKPQNTNNLAELPNRKPAYGSAELPVAERRICERYFPRAKSQWELLNPGSVGSQSLLGIKHLSDLRFKDEIGHQALIWPFETDFENNLSDKPIVIGEVYPSAFGIMETAEDECIDESQVKTLAQGFAHLDNDGSFECLLTAPQALSADERHQAVNNEGWIVGTSSDFLLLVNAIVNGKKRLQNVIVANSSYIRDPAEIYRQSFETVRREANLSSLPNDMHDVAVRLIHSCGMIDIIDDLAFSEGAIRAGTDAFQNGAPIICDVEMVRHGIIRRHLTADNDVLCAIGEETVRATADEIKNTRSAAGMDILKHRLGGAIVVIGNAPTALFRLLELIDAGAAKPALIIGMPVGFVGAAESKQALIEDSRGAAYIAVRGRRGGSAMASATLNALAGGLKGGL